MLSASNSAVTATTPSPSSAHRRWLHIMDLSGDESGCQPTPNPPACVQARTLRGGWHWRLARVSSAGACVLHDRDKPERELTPRHFTAINSHNVVWSLPAASNGIRALARRQWHAASHYFGRPCSSSSSTSSCLMEAASRGSDWPLSDC